MVISQSDVEIVKISKYITVNSNGIAQIVGSFLPFTKRTKYFCCFNLNINNAIFMGFDPIDINLNTSLAVPGALAHRLQRRTACNAAPPATPHRVPVGPKMANRV